MKSSVPLLLLCTALLLLQSCTVYKKNYEDKANDLSQELIIVDGHIGLPHELLNNDNESENSHHDFSYDKARDGGLNAAFMSINASSPQRADSLIGAIRQLATDHSDHYAVATSAGQIEKQFKNDLISLPMGLANKAALGHDLNNLQKFYDKGIRYINISDSESEQMSESSDSSNTGGGQSDFDINLVNKMNHLGMMVDVSGLKEKVFTKVIDTSKAPVIASSSAARYFTPEFKENLSDKMIEKLASNNGLMMINFDSKAISDSSRVTADTLKSHLNRWLEKHDLDRQDPEAQEYIESYREQNFYYASVSEVADHIDHVANLVGIDYVGLGSGFNGEHETMPQNLKDVSDYPNLIQELLKRGYTKDDIRKIGYENLARVWGEVDARAKELSNKSSKSSR